MQWLRVCDARDVLDSIIIDLFDSVQFVRFVRNVVIAWYSSAALFVFSNVTGQAGWNAFRSLHLISNHMGTYHSIRFMGVVHIVLCH